MGFESKKVGTVPSGEIIRHTGDLTVDGDIHEGAVVEITDGSLTVTGNVNQGAQIQIRVSEELRNNASQSSIMNMVGATFGGNVVMSVGGIAIGRGHSTSANMNINIGGKSFLSGNVNIDNRILTNDTVLQCGNDTYEITACDTSDPFALLRNSSARPTGIATVKVDGVTYSGTKIRVEGKTVFVDGRQMGAASSSSSAAAPAEPEGPKMPLKVSVGGKIADGVTINSDVAIETGDIGGGCSILSNYEGLTARNIGDGTSITTRNEIKVREVGSDCVIVSHQYGVNAANVGSHTTIEARNSIELENVGDGCRIQSHQYGITAGNVGVGAVINARNSVTLQNIGAQSRIASHQYGITARNVGLGVEITARNEIKLGNIGARSVITSQQYGVNATDLGDGVTVQARNGIQLKNVGIRCAINSQQYGIEVEEHVGVESHLSARNEIIVGSLADHGRLTSSYGKVKVHGPAGNSVVIEARNAVQMKDVGSNVVITSTNGEVSIRNIGVNGRVNARNDIDIDGTCPNPESLQLTSTSRSRIHRPARAQQVVVQQQIVASAPPAPAQPGIYARGSYERDLEAALAASMETPDGHDLVVAPMSMFAASAVRSLPSHNQAASSSSAPANMEVDESAIPKAYLCPISREVMSDPVICTLDGVSYEKSMITASLKKRRVSPMHGVAMQEGQAIEDVLIPNRALADAIEEFKSAHPELFNEANVPRT